MGDFNPVGLLSRTRNGKTGVQGPFQLEDDFRSWAQRVGISQRECESQINKARGHGYDHLYACLRVYRQQHEQAAAS